MKNILCCSFIVFIFLSCRQSPQHLPTTAGTPEALQDNKSKDFSIVSKKRYDENLVESLYQELVNKTPELKNLEDRIDYLDNVKSDSVFAFNSFNSKNNLYYTGAENKLSQISDSVLRSKINSIISSSKEQYNQQTAKHNDLIEMLNTKSIKLNDAHIVLKILKTLPMIEKYQKDNMPDKNSINRAINEFDKTIEKIDSLKN